jgi:vacuolar-type H+-ATPase subunit H
MPTNDLLERLFDVERTAEAMVSGAREEAGRRLDSAKTRAQRHYTAAYDAARAEALAALEASEASSREEYRAAIESYAQKLESSKIDRAAFDALCDSALDEGL